MNNKIFWKEDWKGKKAMGGIFYRAFDLIKFLKLVEEKTGKVVGIKFDGNNIEVLYEKTT